MRLKNFSKNHIDFEVVDEFGIRIWQLTSIYEEPESHEKGVLRIIAEIR